MARHWPALAPLVAFRFLTVLPLGPAPSGESAQLGRSAAFFPLVGACLGAALLILDLALEPLFSVQVRSVLVLAAHAALTGALHLDGLMDSCDGLFGGRDPARRLEIMRDSRLGTYGAVGGLGVLLLQFACLTELQGAARSAGLVGMAALGRWAMVYATAAFPPARAQGLGASFKRSVGRRELALATATALAVAVVVAGPLGVAIFAIAWVGVGLAAALMLSRVPGLTGDLYGATNELIATLVLLAVVAASTAGLRVGWS